MALPRHHRVGSLILYVTLAQLQRLVIGVATRTLKTKNRPLGLERNGLSNSSLLNSYRSKQANPVAQCSELRQVTHFRPGLDSEQPQVLLYKTEDSDDLHLGLVQSIYRGAKLKGKDESRKLRVTKPGAGSLPATSTSRVRLMHLTCIEGSAKYFTCCMHAVRLGVGLHENGATIHELLQHGYFAGQNESAAFNDAFLKFIFYKANRVPCSQPAFKPYMLVTKGEQF